MPEPQHYRFIGRIRRLIEVRNSRGDDPAQNHTAGLAAAQLAVLRRGIGRQLHEVPSAFPMLLPWLDEAGFSDFGKARRERDEGVWFQVAALYAWHGMGWQSTGSEASAQRRNLGTSLVLLKQRSAENDKGETRKRVNPESLERRFVAMLDCHRDELPTHLRAMVGLLRTGEQPIDWAQLLADLEGEHWERRDTQTAWARSFWGAPPRRADADGESAAVVTEGEDG